ncbi:hypothetical protein [uncultured Erythrobacter sp.]|nr:hypothetical protein [uncultured Erythrobacter sp.]
MGFVSILLALGIAFIAYRVLMGLLRVAVIVLIFGVTFGLWQQGAIG